MNIRDILFFFYNNIKVNTYTIVWGTKKRIAIFSWDWKSCFGIQSIQTAPEYRGTTSLAWFTSRTASLSGQDGFPTESIYDRNQFIIISFLLLNLNPLPLHYRLDFQNNDWQALTTSECTLELGIYNLKYFP